MPPHELFHPDQFRSFANLAEAFFYNADAGPGLVAYDQAQIDPLDDGRERLYVTVLQRESKQRVLKIAAHLQSLGVKPGDAVALLSLDRGEWTEAEMAVYTVGAVLVPAYVRDPLDRLHQILADSRAAYAFVENQEQLDKLLVLMNVPATPADGASLTPQLPPLKFRAFVSFEDVDAPPQFGSTAPPVAVWRDVLNQQAVRPERSFAYVGIARDAVASLFYTSGSTGQPKGVPVTHGQTLENLRQIAEAGLIDYKHYAAAGWQGTQPFVTSILPERAHVFPARIGQLVATTPVRGRFPAVVNRRSSRITCEFRESWRRDLREGGAGIVLVVPQILIAIQQRMRQRLSASGLGVRLARFVIDNAVRHILAEMRHDRQLLTRFLHWACTPLRRLIARHIRRQIVGPQFEFFVCGGAKLPVETTAMLRAIELRAYEGYGSTETNCPIAVNTSSYERLGSVGKLFVDVEVRVDPATREIQIRGPNVAQRYWNRPEETATTWTRDGWCHTRDVGRIDADGFLYVEDRLDGILVLLNGEHVSATAVAGRFAAIPIVETAVVLGHQRPALVALVALNEHAVRRWAAGAGHALADDWRNDPAVTEVLRAEVEDKVNRRAQHGFERIRHLGIIDPPDPEQRTLTATEKVRRGEIEKQNAALIEQLYADQAAEPRRRSPLVAALRRVAAM